MQALRLVLAISLFLSGWTQLVASHLLHDLGGQLPGVIAVEVRFPSRTCIDEHKAKIVSGLNQDYYLQNGIRLTVGIGLLAVCYALYNNYYIAQVDGQAKEQIVASATSAMTEKQNLYRLVIEQNALLKKCLPSEPWPDIQPLQTQPEKNVGWIASIASGTLTTAKWLGALAAQAFTFQFLNKKGAQIFHDNSVEWFYRQKTSLVEVYDEISAMKEFMHVDALKTKSFYITQYQADQYIGSLIRLHNAMILELEPIVGYIHHKSQELELHENHLYGDATLGEYLFKRAYDLAQEIHDIKSAYSHCTDNDERVAAIIKIFDYIELFSLEFKSALGGFKRFEREMNNL